VLPARALPTLRPRDPARSLSAAEGLFPYCSLGVTGRWTHRIRDFVEILVEREPADALSHQRV